MTEENTEQNQTIRYLIAFVVAKISNKTDKHIYDENSAKHYFTTSQSTEDSINISESNPSNRIKGSLSNFSISGQITTTVRNLSISGSSFSGQEQNLGSFNGQISSSKITINDNFGSHDFSI